jgi:hypothetical protein
VKHLKWAPFRQAQTSLKEPTNRLGHLKCTQEGSGLVKKSQPLE